MGDAGMNGAGGSEGARGAAVVMPPVTNPVSPVPLANTAYTPEQYAQYLQEAIGAAQVSLSPLSVSPLCLLSSLYVSLAFPHPFRRHTLHGICYIPSPSLARMQGV